MKIEIGPYDVERTVKIEIDPYDTWSMDVTLAMIIHPMLVQLRETTHGSPKVDNEDVPAELQSSLYDKQRPPSHTKVYDKIQPQCCADDTWHHRWTYVLDEMIWTFENVAKELSGYDICVNESGDTDPPQELIKKTQERLDNGFRLFGKYYSGLWD